MSDKNIQKVARENLDTLRSCFHEPNDDFSISLRAELEELPYKGQPGKPGRLEVLREMIKQENKSDSHHDPNKNGILQALHLEERGKIPNDPVDRENLRLAVENQSIMAYSTAMCIEKNVGPIDAHGHKVGLGRLADQYNDQIRTPEMRKLFVEHFNSDNSPADPFAERTTKAHLEHNRIKFTFEKNT